MLTYPGTDRSTMAYQLCLPLTDVGYNLNGRTPRAIPPIVKELLEVSDDSPSGLIWRVNSMNGRAKVGCPAGTRTKNNKYYLVSVKNHGLFYAHRIVYYLKTGTDPGSMVVRHTDQESMILGWQDDNGRDEKGLSKHKNDNSPVIGSKTSKMYLYEGNVFNLRSLCKHVGLNYGTIYQRINRCNADPCVAFEKEGIRGVVPLFD